MACTGGTPTSTPPDPDDPDPHPDDPTPTPTTTTPPPPGGKKLVGYFAEWGVYGRNYHVKNIETSGSASKLTHILYAFGNTTGGKCSIGDSYAAYDKAYTAADSVDGVADTWDQPLRGNFNQLKKLKAMHPGLKVIWSFGGWTWSSGFTPGRGQPDRVRQLLLRPAERLPLGRPLRRHRHRLGVPERVRPVVRPAVPRRSAT